MGRAELNIIMQAWPKLMRQATSPWACEFAANIWERASDPFWKPTKRQTKIMRLLYNEISELNEEVCLFE